MSHPLLGNQLSFVTRDAFIVLPYSVPRGIYSSENRLLLCCVNSETTQFIPFLIYSIDNQLRASPQAGKRNPIKDLGGKKLQEALPPALYWSFPIRTIKYDPQTQTSPKKEQRAGETENSRGGLLHCTRGCNPGVQILDCQRVPTLSSTLPRE